MEPLIASFRDFNYYWLTIEPRWQLTNVLFENSPNVVLLCCKALFSIKSKFSTLHSSFRHFRVLLCINYRKSWYPCKLNHKTFIWSWHNSNSTLVALSKRCQLNRSLLYRQLLAMPLETRNVVFPSLTTKKREGWKKPNRAPFSSDLP